MFVINRIVVLGVVLYIPINNWLYGTKNCRQGDYWTVRLLLLEILWYINMLWIKWAISITRRTIRWNHSRMYSLLLIHAVEKCSLCGNLLSEAKLSKYVIPWIALYTVNLGHNNISVLSDRSFENNTALRWISLNANKISTIHVDAFEGKPQ